MQVLRAATVKEKDFQRWVIDTARALGWRVWHVPAPMRWDSTGKGKGFVGAKDAAGLSDLILIRGPLLIFAEIKGTRGRLSEKQTEFLDHVYDMGNPFVWARAYRPGDEEQVEADLARPQA